MSTNITDDEIAEAVCTLDAQEVPYPRQVVYRGVHYRIRSEDHQPEFMNDEGQWQTLMPVQP